MTQGRDLAVVFVAKTARTFCYGFLGIALPVYLSELGMSAVAIGASVTFTLLGSAALTWAVRHPAERLGARAALAGLAALSVVAAGILLVSHDPWLVVLAALLGNVAVGTGETGPFLTIEQVVVTRAVAGRRRTLMLTVYNLLGYTAAGLGAATLGLVPAYRPLFMIFLFGALLQWVAYLALTPLRREPGARRPGPALASAPLIRRFAALFALDSFAGGFVLQSLVAYYFHARFGLSLEALGVVFAITQGLTAVSLLLAVRFANRFGLLNTMVVSHLVSNVFLIAIAVAPTAWVAVGLLFLRHLLSQIDVPTRQAYVMAVVADHEREAAASLTNLARTLAQAVTPSITGVVMQTVALAAPFALGGGLKIAYDVLLWATFRHVPLPSENE